MDRYTTSLQMTTENGAQDEEEKQAERIGDVSSGENDLVKHEGSCDLLCVDPHRPSCRRFPPDDQLASINTVADYRL